MLRAPAVVAVASYQAAASLAGLPCPPPSSTAAAATPARCFRSDTSAGGLPSPADAGAAAQVAVSRASRDVLSSLFPSQAADFDALHSRVLARVALAAGSLRAGEAAGAACAAAVVALRANDNAFSCAPWPLSRASIAVFDVPVGCPAHAKRRADDLSLAPSDATAFMASMAPGYWQPATTDNSLLMCVAARRGPFARRARTMQVQLLTLVPAQSWLYDGARPQLAARHAVGDDIWRSVPGQRAASYEQHRLAR